MAKKGNNLRANFHVPVILLSSGLYQEGNNSTHAITEVKHLELNQFSVGSKKIVG